MIAVVGNVSGYALQSHAKGKIDAAGLGRAEIPLEAACLP